MGGVSLSGEPLVSDSAKKLLKFIQNGRPFVGSDIEHDGCIFGWLSHSEAEALLAELSEIEPDRFADVELDELHSELVESLQEVPPFDGLLYPSGDTGNFARIRFSSTLNNLELNFRSRVAGSQPVQTSVLLGARFMKLDEEFIYDKDPSTDAAITSVTNINVSTSNTLLGLQAGLLFQYRWPPGIWFDYEVKGGIYTDRARQNTTSDAFVGTMGAEKDVTPFSIDMSLISNWQLHPSTTLRLGYNFLWIDGVALGAQNVQTNADQLTLGPPKLDHTGSVIYHGPSLGIVFAR